MGRSFALGIEAASFFILMGGDGVGFRGGD